MAFACSGLRTACVSLGHPRGPWQPAVPALQSQLLYPAQQRKSELPEPAEHGGLEITFFLVYFVASGGDFDLSVL